MVFKLLFVILVLTAILVCPSESGDSRIVGGYQSLIHLRPYQVSLRYRSKLEVITPFRHNCGGSIYDKNFIITAAHCSVNRVAAQLKVVAGSSFSSGTSGAICSVKEIIYHQDFNPDTFANDIAVLVLETPLPINNFTIRPIELGDRDYPAGTNAVVSGWGHQRYGGSTRFQLQEVTIPLVSFEDCKNAYKAIGDNLTEGMLCAGVFPEGGKDACQGDSGGPVVIENKLVGAVSAGEGCAFPNFPGINTDINYMRPWILEKIADAQKRYNFTN